nr:reverse transcriptase domain-containing protein [Tanacetum cinerariifolium]
EITRFQQRFDESFYEAWDRFNDLLRASPHHGLSELHQLDTFYNALNINDQDSLNSAAGENFLDKMPRECLKIIESKSKVRQSRAKAVVAKVNQPPVYQAHIPQTQNVSNTDFEMYIKANDAILRNMQSQGQRSGTLPSNTITNPKEELKGTEVTKDQVQIPSSQSTAPIQPPVSQSETPTSISEPVVAPVSASMPNMKSSIPYLLRRDNKRRRDQANEQIKKFYVISKDMSFEISFMELTDRSVSKPIKI